MNTEKLEQANKLLKEIKRLTDHRDEIKGSNGEEIHYFEGASEITVRPEAVGCVYNQRRLWHKFLPFQLEKFVKLYISNVEEEIARLEKEFENL